MVADRTSTPLFCAVTVNMAKPLALEVVASVWPVSGPELTVKVTLAPTSGIPEPSRQLAVTVTLERASAPVALAVSVTESCKVKSTLIDAMAVVFVVGFRYLAVIVSVPDFPLFVNVKVALPDELVVA